MNHNIVILRARKGVPGIGRKLSRYFDCNEVTAKSWPKIPISAGAVIVNYGRSVIPVWLDEAVYKNSCPIINHPFAVGLCVDKLKCFRQLAIHGVPTLRFTDYKDYAEAEFKNGIIVRHTKVGKKGQGIEYVPYGEELPHAPLYTEHYDKTHEYRVHVFCGKVIDFVQKKKNGKKGLAKKGLDEVNMLIRNNGKGWAFCRNDILHHPFIEELAILAAQVLEVDYCGVDILARWEDGELLDCVVCEVNSAPSMKDKNTFEAYTKAIGELL